MSDEPKNEAAAPSGARGGDETGAREYPVGLAAQFRQNLWLYVAGTLLIVAQQYLMGRRDLFVKSAVDAATSSQVEAGVRAALMMLLVAVLAALGRVLSRVTIFTGGRNVEYQLRATLLARLHKLGPAFFRKMPTGEIMSRATNDLTQVRLLLGFGILNVVSSILAFSSALWVMISRSGKLTVAALATLPLLVSFTRYVSPRLFKFNREAQESIGQMSDRVLASLAGVRVVRSFTLEESEARAFSKVNDRYLEKNLALARVRGSMGPIMGAISSVGALVVFWYGGELVLRGEMTKGDFVAFWLALQRITWPMLALGFVWAIVQRGRAGYERLKVIFDAVPEVLSGPLPAPDHVAGAVRVEHLGFAYGARKVLEDVSFDVPAGRSLAIVGRTGSGKSTLAVLLARLLPTPRGTVFLDGADVCDLPLETVRASIGYAQQDAFLFSTTVSENVGYSLDERDDDDAQRTIRHAAAEAEIASEIESLPEGFDTVVGERGVQLSGGQKQRTALAAAFVSEPQVLVLDDPLSAVDARTERGILDAIDRQRKARSLILITHRVAAASHCDEIIVLDRGRVVERGTHDELRRSGGLYAAFAEEQRIESELQALEGEPLDPTAAAAAEGAGA
ncbi:MAG TPA: ABC transporter ATP-binding protein [Byssovorax sp.]